MNDQAGPPANHKSIFWISVLALFTAALANSVRAGAAGALKTSLLDPIDAQHSGEMIGTVLGNSFLGFALSLLVISPLLDRFGAKKVILFAAACFIVGPALVLFSAGAGGSTYTLLNIAMIIWGFGWGATEASINPITATIYPNDKTGKLNVLHAWWPAGIVAGGLLSVLFFKQLNLDWQVLVGLTIVPGVVLALWAMRHEFPQTESTAQGVTFNEMMAEPFKRPSFWVFFAIMFLTASAELAPGAWVDVTLTETVGFSGILVLVYVSAIMFVMRHFAGALDHKFSDMGLLWFSTVPAAIGLYLLSTANSATTALVAATFWAFGVCFMWPTMLAAVSRRFPRSGPWGIGLIGFAGALAIRFVLPKLGEIYDNAKLAKAGGKEALEAVQPGTPEMHGVLAYAAETSFQTIAIIPAVLFVIFGLVWFFERGKNTK
ncbi:sugar MFS transporter [Novosphingobium sp. TH158]|uniref:MFS transporter n=1 Tax=Novosphingobium sp. TH158 TaxID=2067455 RepID=UPI000C7D74D5|nr:MFS transporter [Novosphingobium sp. TH158]PLK26445.1 MFS transporter [Novosphingobium sp. TH158]